MLFFYFVSRVASIQNSSGLLSHFLQWHESGLTQSKFNKCLWPWDPKTCLKGSVCLGLMDFLFPMKAGNTGSCWCCSRPSVLECCSPQTKGSISGLPSHVHLSASIPAELPGLLASESQSLLIFSVLWTALHKSLRYVTGSSAATNNSLPISEFADVFELSPEGKLYLSIETLKSSQAFKLHQLLCSWTLLHFQDDVDCPFCQFHSSVVFLS